jgi:hypothetical protein
MCLGLSDRAPDLDPLVRRMDLALDPSIISKKNFLLFCEFYVTFYLSKLCKGNFKK